MKKVTALILAAGGVLGGGLMSFRYMQAMQKEKNRKLEKYMSYFYILNNWMSLKENGVTLEEYFSENGYLSVEIYGMGYLGRHLLEELRNTDISVICGIDSNPSLTVAGLTVKTLEDDLPGADVMVVTPVFDFDEVAESLHKKVSCPIVSLEDVVSSLL